MACDCELQATVDRLEEELDIARLDIANLEKKINSVLLISSVQAELIESLRCRVERGAVARVRSA